MAYPKPNHAFNIRNFGATDTSGADYVFYQPRPKYTFFAKFEINTDAEPQWYQDAYRSGHILAAVASVDHPSTSYSIESLRTYNGVRHVPTKIEYDPVNVRFLDDSASLVANLLKEYRKFYHYSGDATTAEDFGDGLPGGGSPRGGSLPSIGMKTRSPRCFFKEITIYDLGTAPGSINVFHLINPTVSSVKHSALDYYDGTGMSDVNVSFRYEGYWDEIGVKVTEKEEALIQLGEQTDEDKPNTGQLGSYGGAKGNTGSLLDDILGRLPGIISGAIGGGGLNLDALKNTLLTELTSASPLGDIRSAITAAEAGAAAISKGDYKAFIDASQIFLRDNREISGILPFVQAATGSWSLPEAATRSAKSLLGSVSIGNVNILDLFD